MSDEYSCVAKGKLKLKNDAELMKKKKKSRKNKTNKTTVIGGNTNDDNNGPISKRQRPATKNHNEDNEEEHPELLTRISTEKNRKSSLESNTDIAGTSRRFTKAELAFKQQQQAMRNKRILEMASTTHKQRVEKFNEHLDTLTEHFDIPKVSWTK